ncbi:serine O-acetyltransferase [Fluoribacter gormanii]|uniref:serine O-acetyltransferase n=1 Tax=Fluoribacter gormanii TaxID=464 RepID=UPI0010418C12|nr:serine O-acetyltransferase [Fluoribacter gormanii]
MFALINAYKKRDPAARNGLEVLLLYPGIKALFFHRIAHPLYRLGIPIIPRMLAEISRWLTGIEIHPGAVLGKNVVIDHGMGIVIGETSIIGDNVLLYHGVTLGATHYKEGKRHPSVRSGAIIGAGSKILGDIVIGEHAQIGANSVVLKSVPPGASVVGAPARIINKATKKYIEWDFDYHI